VPPLLVEPPVIDVLPVRFTFGSPPSLEQPVTARRAALPATKIIEAKLVVRIGNILSSA
jgi:hypothetical protein